MSYDARIEPMRDLYDVLLEVRKPARYIGGEAHSPAPCDVDDPRLKVALSFPDLYEIGMSNNAIRIIYSILNEKYKDVVCERVFAPAPDFEKALIEKRIPLYTLESGIPLCRTDVLAFSVGYELLATNILTILERGYVPLLNEERSDGDPIVIAGGPAITNPAPFSHFIDAVWIGEAEEGFADILVQLANLKKMGATRAEKIYMLSAHQSIWISHYTNKKYEIAPKKRVVRSVFTHFPTQEREIQFPLSVLNPVHSHGSVEIMRGCPNGCRFCHAGYYYRPQRAKPRHIIENEVRKLIEQYGYREITLSSLSSGDYPGISELFDELNAEWADQKISFQLPSLKVESFTLPLLEKMAEVRKSGLTFAIETPLDSWQCAINKRVPFESVVNILREAKLKGFRSAKFYFMIGLPIPEQGMREAEEIVKYIETIALIARISLHVNVGTFIPKPHTPFERERQLSEEEALECLTYIKKSLRHLKNVEVSYHSPFLSLIEGIISRGDESISDLIIRAYQRGTRLDAWDEYVNKEAWKEVLTEYDAQRGEGAWKKCIEKREENEVLPWHTISLRVSKTWLNKEKIKSQQSILSLTCSENCTDLCGVCTKFSRVVSNSILHNNSQSSEVLLANNDKDVEETVTQGQSDSKSTVCRKLRHFISPEPEEATSIKIVALWSKNEHAIMYPLHDVSNSIIKSLQITGIPLAYTQGYNPQPKLELSPPLPLGVSGENELAILWCSTHSSRVDEFKEYLIDKKKIVLECINDHLPRGLYFKNFKVSTNKNQKATIGSLFDAATWTYQFASEYSFKTAVDILGNVAHEYAEVKIEPSSFTLHLIEPFVGASGKSKSFFKELKLKFSELQILSRDIRAIRSSCFGTEGTFRRELYELL